jgi:4-amino-4-deoxy-L-arabinose transferase-like glycosyltransferase
VLLMAALIGGLVGRRDARWAIVLGWALGTWASVSLSGRFYAHYYMLWLPLISIGTGAAFSLAHLMSNARLALAVRAGIVLVLVVVAARQVGQVFQYDARSAVLAKYGYRGAVFTETRALGGRIAETLPSERSVFEVGAHGLYFYAGRLAPMPFVDSLYGIDSAYPKLYRERMLPALLQAPPDVLVIRRGILRSGTDIAQRDFVATLLDSAPYVEDKSLSGEYLLVLRRLRKDSQ